MIQTQRNIKQIKAWTVLECKTESLKMVFVAFLLLGLTYGKIYERCELARELKFVHKASNHQLATWVCIAEHESQYNTSIVGHLNGDGSGDHGIFQISDQYWCSPPGKGYACGLTCAELENDDISDDFVCAQTIYKEHKQLSGDGFNAWAVYQSHCKGSKADHYLKDCFNESERPKTLAANTSVFAHGFFDTVAGRANKGFSMTTQKPPFVPFLNFRSPSTIQSQKFTLTTKKPDLNSFLISKSSFFTNRFFTSTENSNPDSFFTPKTTNIIKSIPSTTATYIPKTTIRPSENNKIIINPTMSTPASVSPTGIRTSFFKTKKTFPSPSNKIFFTPTVTTNAYQTSTVSYPTPIFIFNGVKWY